MRTRRRAFGVRRLTAATANTLGLCRERKDRERRSERKDDFGSAESIHCWKTPLSPCTGGMTAKPARVLVADRFRRSLLVTNQ
jgi:hypothetical protein